jgi:dihydrofolate synthase/folylpolyglutamate synthase
MNKPTYQQTLDYLFSQLPMFTRDGASAFKKDLTNTLELCKRMGDPQHQFKSIHVGGTNGKGSTSHMLAAILQTAGYKTGLYTSPHLRDFRERIRIDGQMITEETVVDFVARHRDDFEEIKPSFFEMTVAMAFDIFAKERVDIAIVEVGLGGRLDSTNVITPLISVITNIGWDHMNMLGNSLTLIAGEKAGIIKHRVPVIIGEYQSEVAGVFLEKARQENAPIRFASDAFSLVPVVAEQSSRVGDFSRRNSGPDFLEAEILTPNDREPYSDSNSPALVLKLDLTGTYQLKNVKTVLAVIIELRKQGFLIDNEHVKKALRQVKLLTGLHGRWETLATRPLTICDTGHNPEGIAEVLKNIGDVAYERLHFVIGMVNDKDHSKVLAMLPADAIYYFCKPNIPRGLNAQALMQQAANFDLHGQAYLNVTEALEAARKNAAINDLVFIGGSTFVVAEVI